MLSCSLNPDMAESRSKLAYLVLSVALVLSGVIAVTVKWCHQPSSATADTPKPPSAPKPEAKPVIPTLDQPTKAGDPEIGINDLGLGVAAVDPATLVARIGKALEAGDLETAMKLIGKQALDPKSEERLKALAGMNGLKLRQPPVREVGELELNALTRYALELDAAEPGRDRIFLDLRRKDGKWTVEKLILPPAPGEQVPRAVLVDALGISDAFLQAVLRQNFELAKEFADPATVSDAKIAGLCILFEEGNYRLRPEKPLRSLMNRPEAAGFLANVETTDGKAAAEFTLMLRQPPGGGNWRVSEVNLDKLLADYAKRFAGGDVYFSPLVKNPKGGDTLVLYFDFDQDQVGERTRRQLDIVAQILKTDGGKKLTLSGHTDALGDASYNERLSSRRAAVVKEYLAAAGVAKSQIVTEGKGMSQPRRPNFTESGADNPEGRRVNRRTEIYLDF
jgi:OmpA-OmpF porin, OOP family